MKVQENCHPRNEELVAPLSSPDITVRWIVVVVAGFPPLSSFVKVMFQGRLFPHLCAFNPDGPAASTAFVVNSHFVVATPLVRRQK